MCNFQPVYNYLNAVYAAIAAAMVLIGSAAILNASFLGAPGSPALMVLAGTSTSSAIVLLGIALGKMNAFISCKGDLEKCRGNKSNFNNALNALRTVLGIQAAACFAAAGVAWVPWAGLAPMYAIATTLLIQLAMVTALIIYARSLINCLQPRDTSGENL